MQSKHCTVPAPGFENAPKGIQSKLEQKARAVHRGLAAIENDPSRLESQAEWRWIRGLPSGDSGSAVDRRGLTHIEPLILDITLDTKMARVRNNVLSAVWHHSKSNIDWMTFSPEHVAARGRNTVNDEAVASRVFRKATLQIPEDDGLSGSSMSIDDNDELALIFDALGEHLSVYASLARQGVERMKSDLGSRTGEDSIQALSYATVNQASPDLARGCPKAYQEKIVGYQGDIIKAGMAVSQLRKISTMAGDFVKSAITSMHREIDGVALLCDGTDTRWIGDAARLRGLSKLRNRYWDSLIQISEHMDILGDLASDFAAWQVAELQWQFVREATQKALKAENSKTVVKGAKMPKTKTAKQVREQLTQSTPHTKGLFTASETERQATRAELYRQSVKERKRTMKKWSDHPLLKEVMEAISRGELSGTITQLEASLARQRGKPDNWRDMTILGLREYGEERLEQRRNRVPLSQQVRSWLLNTGSGWSQAVTASIWGLTSRTSATDAPKALEADTLACADAEFRGQSAVGDSDDEPESGDGDSDLEFFYDAAEVLPDAEGKWDLSKVTREDEPGWTEISYHRQNSRQSAEVRRSRAVDKIVRGVLGPPSVYKAPRVPAPSAVYSLQHDRKSRNAVIGRSAQSWKQESSLTAARARNLFKRSWAGTLNPLSHAEQRERLTSLQAKVIRSEERAFSAQGRELSKPQTRQSRLIKSLQNKWRKERREFADDSGWMVLSSRWLGWVADDAEPQAPAKLQGTDQGGYAFPTEAERAGKYLSVLGTSFDLEEGEAKEGSIASVEASELMSGPSESTGAEQSEELCPPPGRSRRANSL